MVDVKYVCKVKFKLVHPAPHHPFKGLVKPLNEFHDSALSAAAQNHF
jgi:hypothetical protein